jgi:site-specific recombinase XerD
MIRSKALGKHSMPTFGHVSAEEYAVFIQEYTDQAGYRMALLRFREYFVQRYPNLLDWFAAPLTERVGVLYGEDRHHACCQISYQARLYLIFLALCGSAPLDWEWLIAVPKVRLEKLLNQPMFQSNFSKLIEEAVNLGYKRDSVQKSLQWTVHRIFLHIGTTLIEHIRADHIAELTEALEHFRSRSDVALFFGSVEQCTKSLNTYYQSLQVLQTVLYHRGQISTEGLKIPRRRSFSHEVLKPRMEAVVARYLTARRLTDQPRTVSDFDEVLHHFLDGLAQRHPHIETLAEVTRHHLMEYAETLTTMRGAKTGQPFAATTRKKMLSRLSVFFNNIAFWEWDDVPKRPLLQYGDLPQLPQRVPRYIPKNELDRLMTAIRALDCPYQRTALLIARWSGARRDEIHRLSIDCLDSYPDGMPRLRIPASKTRCERLIPLNQEAAEAIHTLQAYRKGERGLRDRQTGVETRYLFMHFGKQFSTQYLFDNSLEKACAAAGLVTSDGKPTVTPHRFRHTVGTQLAQSGARLRTIQKILGHESVEMSLVYIGITDEDVRKDYQAVFGPGAIIAGPGAERIQSGGLAQPEVDWLKSNFLKTELELGRCLRLPQEGPCECDLYLTCAKFVTSPEYAPRLRRRRKCEQKLVEDALAHGWQREVERHQWTVRRIEHLLTDLGEPLDGSEAID